MDPSAIWRPNGFLLKLRAAHARAKGMPFWVLVTRVKDARPGAALCVLEMAVGDTKHCWRCGMTLDDEISEKLGYGPDCCKLLKIDRAKASRQDAVMALREAAAQWGPREEWVPFAQVREGLEPLMASATPLIEAKLEAERKRQAEQRLLEQKEADRRLDAAARTVTLQQVIEQAQPGTKAEAARQWFLFMKRREEGK